MIYLIRVRKGDEWGWLGEPGESPFATPEWEARKFDGLHDAMRECEMSFMAENYDEWRLVTFTPREIPTPLPPPAGREGHPMQEFATCGAVPQHEVERRLREEFGRDAAGERGVAEDFEAWVRGTARRWQKLVEFIDRFKAAMEEPGGGGTQTTKPSPPADADTGDSWAPGEPAG